jgi:N-formylglutamate deformylase
MNVNPVRVSQGSSPVILAFPHAGTSVPDYIWQDLNDNGRTLSDTDWHIDTLYDSLLPNTTTVTATFHRYVIDANRDPTGASLYPGQNTTALVPVTDFDGTPIWYTQPSTDEIRQRLNVFHAPYHAALSAEIARVKSLHGFVILYDCHSIRSHIPFLFDGTLPDFNIGTDSGRTCASSIEKTVADICNNVPGYTSVLNGRFKGGWTTRHYGKPEHSVHAIQMELAQKTYLETETLPFHYADAKAQRLRQNLHSILNTLASLNLEQFP